MMYELLSDDALLPSPKDKQKLSELSVGALGGSEAALKDLRTMLGFD
jgi:hypothetical protein